MLAPVPPALQWNTVVGDENCLSLNVFAPAWSRADAVPGGSDTRRPVMVWIHGGGNGRRHLAPPTTWRGNYARQDGFVVVTINYRLGLLGWSCPIRRCSLRIPTPRPRSVRATSACSTRSPHCAGSATTMSVLRRRSRPKVTIFGESAGGQSVLLLLASPLAAGLFHRAIAQSPVCREPSASMQEAVERQRVAARQPTLRTQRRRDRRAPVGGGEVVPPIVAQAIAGRARRPGERGGGVPAVAGTFGRVARRW